MPDFRPRPSSVRPAVQLGRPAHGSESASQQQVRAASDLEWIRTFAEAIQAVLQLVQAAPVIATELSDVLLADRELAASADINFTDGGAKDQLSFGLTLTGIAPATYGAALKIPIITFDDKGRATLASEVSLGTSAALDSDNDPTLSANSATRLATQQAVRAFVSQAVAGLLEYKSDLNCSTNPNYPAGEKGDAYLVTVAGKIGGALGKSVDIGDFIIARADNAGGTEASVGTSWFVLEHNLAGALLAGNNLSDLANLVTARTNLGLAIGSDVQAYSAKLAAYAGGDTPSAFTLGIVDSADQAAWRAAIGAMAASDYATGTWTPTVSAGSGAITSYTASGHYTKIGRLVIASATIDITTNGTGGAFVNFSLPFAAFASAILMGTGREGGVTGNQLQVIINPTATDANVLTYANGYPGGNGHKLICTVAYFT